MSSSFWKRWISIKGSCPLSPEGLTLMKTRTKIYYGTERGAFSWESNDVALLRRLIPFSTAEQAEVRKDHAKLKIAEVVLHAARVSRSRTSSSVV
jgi:hypothetical protein